MNLEQNRLAKEMGEFISEMPRIPGLEWVKDPEFLLYFEAERLLAMRRVMLENGIARDAPLRVLDFGYLHGLVPEFLHRFFPNAKFLVFDHPASPVFRSPEYLQLIKKRAYVELEARDLAQLEDVTGEYDLMVLGEIIEHLDPTVFIKLSDSGKRLLKKGGHMLITTPNSAGLLNLIETARGRDAQHPVIPDEVMQYGHIHLWSQPLLHSGAFSLGAGGWPPWRLLMVSRLGSSGRRTATGDRCHISLPILRITFFLASWRPAWRGYFVSLWERGSEG